jgi:hypothetical protein
VQKILIFSLFVLASLISINEAYGSLTPVIPLYIEDDVPTIDEFKKYTQHELLENFTPLSLVRENGEQIDSYYFFEKSKNFRMIVYIEDSTNERLENYFPFTSDYFLMNFKMNDNETYFVYAERTGNACLFPDYKSSDFWNGFYSGCHGGAVEVKETDNGFAFYILFFGKEITPTLEEPHLFYFDYHDIVEIDEDTNPEFERFYFPDLWSVGQTIPFTNDDSKTFQVNSGSITVNDFLYKPFDILTENLNENDFECADDTISLTTKKQKYSLDENVQVDYKINSEFLSETRIKLTLYDYDGNIVLEKFTNSSKDRGLFLIDLDGTGNKIQKGVYQAEMEYGFDGPKKSTYFVVGDGQIPDKTDTCKFYLLYDKFSKSLSFLIHVDDPTNTGYDQVQIYVDKQGDSTKKLDADDVSYLINTSTFGAREYVNDGGWMTKSEYYENAKMLKSNDGYDALIFINHVTKNFRFAIDQIDHTGFELKSTRIPSNGFSTIPEFWANAELSDEKPSLLIADRYQPDEILLTQILDVNLILVGDTWDSEIKNLIKQDLNSSYSPIIDSKLNRAGITYQYDFKFLDVSESDSEKLFDYVNSESRSWRGTFYGEGDFEEPWGLGTWIKGNHPEWTGRDRYDVDFKIMDVSKMEEYIQQNIISTNNSFTKPSSANLVFIAGDMDDIDFLHTYELRTKDTATNEYHDAIGMMGFGGKYNFYFFDLYSVPWHSTQGLPDSDPTDDIGMYDKTWDNNMINLHDIHTSERHAKLISDYANNSLSFLITPSYLYEPIYKSKYVADIMLISMGSDVSNRAVSDKFFDPLKIKHELEKLTPFSEWTVKFSIVDILDKSLPISLKNAIDSQNTIQISEEYPELGTIQVLDSEKIKKAIYEWTATRNNNFESNENIQNSSWTIPIVIVVDDFENYLFMDNFGGLGIAPAHPDNPTQPCCALGVTTDWEMWRLHSSVTDLALHELGHTLSFMHPFMGYADDGEFQTYDFFEKWYWGVMGYNQPIQGCGLWYTYLVQGPDDTCGIADTFFTEFDRDNFSRGITINLIKSAKVNIYHSMIELEKNGQDLNNLSQETKNTLNEINLFLNKAESKLKENDLTSKNGALKNALEGAIISSKFAEKSNVFDELEPSSAPKFNVPPWVKNNASWWADDKISENDFLQGIEFLINQRILLIPEIVESSSESTSVPPWVKNNASWWGDDLISDSDFVLSVQFLISNGIIQVDSSNLDFLIVEEPSQNNTLKMDFTKISKPEHREIKEVTITGSVPEFNKGYPVVITITSPNGDENEQKISLTNNMFKGTIQFTEHFDIGTYEITATYAYRDVDLGSVLFYITK